MIIKIITLILLLVSPFGFLFGYTIGGKEVIEIEWQGNVIECIENEIIIRLKDNVSPNTMLNYLLSEGFHVMNDFDELRIGRFEIPETYYLLDALSFLETNLDIEEIGPNGVTHTYFIPDDEYFLYQWGLHNVGGSPHYGTPDADIDAPRGWEEEKGDPSIKIGILDTGIPLQDNMLSHPDLNNASKIELGADFTGDGEGVKDNVGHGTHIAGIVAAQTNNSIGVAGVCWYCKMRIIQVFGGSLNLVVEIYLSSAIYLAVLLTGIQMVKT